MQLDFEKIRSPRQLGQKILEIVSLSRKFGDATLELSFSQDTPYCIFKASYQVVNYSYPDQGFWRFPNSSVDCKLKLTGTTSIRFGPNQRGWQVISSRSAVVLVPPGDYRVQIYQYLRGPNFLLQLTSTTDPKPVPVHSSLMRQPSLPEAIDSRLFDPTFDEVLLGDLLPLTVAYELYETQVPPPFHLAESPNMVDCSQPKAQLFVRLED